MIPQSEPDDLIYKQLGARICIICYKERAALTNIMMDMEDSRALGREVRVCPQCGLISIGEPLPRQLKKFWDDRPEDLPEQERITA